MSNALADLTSQLVAVQHRVRGALLGRLVDIRRGPWRGRRGTIVHCCCDGDGISVGVRLTLRRGGQSANVTYHWLWRLGCEADAVLVAVSP